MFYYVITVDPLNRVQITLWRGGTVPCLSPENRSRQGTDAEVLEVDCGGDHPCSAEDAKIVGEDSLMMRVCDLVVDGRADASIGNA